MELEEAIKKIKDRTKRSKDCMKAIASQKDNFKNDEDYIYFKEDTEAINTVLEELNNRISKEKIRNYLDARINIVIDDKLNSKDKIQIATDEGIEKLLKMIRQDLLENKE